MAVAATTDHLSLHPPLLLSHTHSAMSPLLLYPTTSSLSSLAMHPPYFFSAGLRVSFATKVSLLLPLAGLDTGGRSSRSPEIKLEDDRSAEVLGSL